jgi:hypothetical protein
MTVPSTGSEGARGRGQKNFRSQAPFTLRVASTGMTGSSISSSILARLLIGISSIASRLNTTSTHANGPFRPTRQQPARSSIDPREYLAAEDMPLLGFGTRQRVGGLDGKRKTQSPAITETSGRTFS